MDIFLDVKTGLTNQIYEQVRSGIVEGRLVAGDRLPPTRELAASLGVSRHTVTTAYGRLVAEGYLDGNKGGGTFVSTVFTDEARPRQASTDEEPVRTADEGQLNYDLRVGMPDPQLFPLAEWKRSARWAFDESPGSYGDPAGMPELRRVLARWIARSRGVSASYRQLVVTSGAQQALYLVARVCANPGDVVAVEDPGYRPFVRVLESIGARPAPVAVDDEGIVVDAIPRQARLVYVTPSHQFPTGVTMSMERRMALLELARRRQMVVIEDDYDSEYRYVDRPLEPLFRLDPNGPVVYVASFSKMLSPALRLGFAVVPEALANEVLRLRQLIDWAPPIADQLTLRGFVADGRLDRHLRRARKDYNSRHALLSGLLGEAAERDVVYPSVSNAGLHVAARLVEDREDEIVDRLCELGVAIEGFRRYSLQADSAGIVLGFGLTGGARLEDAVALTRTVLFT